MAPQGAGSTARRIRTGPDEFEQYVTEPSQKKISTTAVHLLEDEIQHCHALLHSRAEEKGVREQGLAQKQNDLSELS